MVEEPLIQISGALMAQTDFGMLSMILMLLKKN